MSTSRSSVDMRDTISYAKHMPTSLRSVSMAPKLLIWTKHECFGFNNMINRDAKIRWH